MWRWAETTILALCGDKVAAKDGSRDSTAAMGDGGQHWSYLITVRFFILFPTEMQPWLF